jgi:hypothetical protein
MDIFVAVDGNDLASGTVEAPLGSLQTAVARCRSAVPEEPRTIHLLEGTHYLGRRSLVLTPADSGLTICSDEQATLSGGRRLSCAWKPWRDGIFAAAVPEGLDFGQLFANGKRQVLARFPKRDDSDTENYSGYTQAAGVIEDDVPDPDPDPDADMTYPHQPKRGILFDPATFSDKTWARPEEARIHIYQSYYWGNLQWDVKAIDRENGRIWFGEGGHQLGAQYSHSPMSVDQRSRFFIENVFEELSAPGEWYHDRESATLYWIPPDGVDPQTAVIEVPQLKTLVEFRGAQRQPVRDVTFDGIRFACTASTYMDHYEIPSLGDWALCRSGTVLMEGTRNCAIRDSWFDAVGGNAVFVNRYNRDVDITGCTFTETGDSAICFVGEYESTTGTQKPFPYECRVHNNHIHHCGEYGKQIAGVYISRAKRITVSHNLIHDMSRAGICIGDGTWGGHILEYNHVHDTCQQTHDHGPFNSWGRERYWSLIHSHFEQSDQNCNVAGDVLFDAMEPTVIRNNLFVEHKGWGIDLDDGSSNYELCNNVCIGVSMKLREGAYRTVHNNIWINPANPPSFHVGNIDNHDRYFHNITVMSPETVCAEHDFDFKSEVTGNEIYAITFPPAVGPWFEEVDRNCFFNAAGEFLMRIRPRGGGPQEVWGLAEWQQQGFDHNSVYGDPLFEDPENGNYRVKPDSPALKVGFKNFEMGGWGLKKAFRCWPGKALGVRR